MPVLGIPSSRVRRVKETGRTPSPFTFRPGFACLRINLNSDLSEQTHIAPAVGQIPRFFVHRRNEAVVIGAQGVSLRLDLRVAKRKRPYPALVANAVEEIEQDSPILESRLVSALKA